MVSEKDMKNAFRIAYDVLKARQEPVFTDEYFAGVCKEFCDLVSANKGNRLLPRLLLGVYEYLEEDARERKDK